MFLKFYNSHNSLQIVEELKALASKVPEKEKWVSLMFDEMSIKEDLVSIMLQTSLFQIGCNE